MPISHLEESSIHYLESGEGKALVILHGLGKHFNEYVTEFLLRQKAGKD
ncbi:hypothetical protein QUF86_20720 [Peribacillus sp. NJ11]|nr:hypothetical protein [Peribacillus sp. NJ11]MDM5223119.1 hypothetical protein [Peribacillus sp. NJ11]